MFSWAGMSITAAPWLTPLASTSRVWPRRNSSAHVTPLPHSGCACCTLPLSRSAAVTGLRQAITDASVGDGWVATLCGFMVPGMRTMASDEFASTLSASAPVQPLMKL